MTAILSRYLHLVCTVYFSCMAVAHFAGLKYPILFIYYDVPFYAYQDKIISFAVVAYVALFWQSFRKKDVRTTAITVMYITVAGLVSVNCSDALREAMGNDQSTIAYWFQTGGILVLCLVMTALHYLDKDIPDQ